MIDSYTTTTITTGGFDRWTDTRIALIDGTVIYESGTLVSTGTGSIIIGRAGPVQRRSMADGPVRQFAKDIAKYFDCLERWAALQSTTVPRQRVDSRVVSPSHGPARSRKRFAFLRRQPSLHCKRE